MVLRPSQSRAHCPAKTHFVCTNYVDTHVGEPSSFAPPTIPLAAKRVENGFPRMGYDREDFGGGLASGAVVGVSWLPPQRGEFPIWREIQT